MNLKKALDLIFYGASAMAIMSLPFLLANWWRYMKARARAAFPSSRAAVPFPAKSIGLFVTSILIAAAAASVATTSARQEAQRFLRELPSDVTVYVNGQPISDQEEVLSTLEGVTSYWAHHSHPTTWIRVDVMSSKATCRWS